MRDWRALPRNSLRCEFAEPPKGMLAKVLVIISVLVVGAKDGRGFEKPSGREGDAFVVDRQWTLQFLRLPLLFLQSQCDIVGSCLELRNFSLQRRDCTFLVA